MVDHPYIDFDGDGHGDRYDTVVGDHGAQQFIHHDQYGHVDAIAWDHNRDGLIDVLMTDDDHDGRLDTYQTDTNGDGYMDTSNPTHGEGGLQHHPYIDFDGDGHGDKYYSTTDGGTDRYYHVDGHGQIDAEALDFDRNGLMDRLFVDSNHDGNFDRAYVDTNGDGIMDRAY
jgi:hypothetical protein